MTGPPARACEALDLESAGEPLVLVVAANQTALRQALGSKALTYSRDWRRGQPGLRRERPAVLELRRRRREVEAWTATPSVPCRTRPAAARGVALSKHGRDSASSSSAATRL